MAQTVKDIKAKTVDEYIAGFPKDTQSILEAIRQAIKNAAPNAEETIKYAIPTYSMDGKQLSFGAWKKHVGLYPAPREIEEFREELSKYDGEKSTVKFSLGQPLPLDLIERIARHRLT